MGPTRRSAPGGSDGDGEKAGNPAAPASRYSACARNPSRDPSTAPTSSTAIGVKVNGTDVNGSGTLNCAAAAVIATPSATAAHLEGRRQ